MFKKILLGMALFSTPVFATEFTFYNKTAQNVYAVAATDWSSNPDPVFGSVSGYFTATGYWHVPAYSSKKVTIGDTNIHAVWLWIKADGAEWNGSGREWFRLKPGGCKKYSTEWSCETEGAKKSGLKVPEHVANAALAGAPFYFYKTSVRGGGEFTWGN